MGEYASRRVVTEFADWFEQELPEIVEKGIMLPVIRMIWKEKLIRLDEELRAYGTEHGIKLGTTATCMFFWKDTYLLVQSGDSRAYEIRRKAVQLSEDQSYVQEQVRLGKLSPEEARHHPNRNVLTDCIGGSRPSVPVTETGQVRGNAVYMLCSDGLVHETEEKELADRLSPKRCGNISALHEALVQLTEDVKLRGETDNITAVGMHVKKERWPKQMGETFRVIKKLMVYDSSKEGMETSGEDGDG